MRELIYARITSYRYMMGRDQFNDRYGRMKTMRVNFLDGSSKHVRDIDFTQLDDETLLDVYERIVAKMNQPWA